ncbi:hypothetical protein B0H15DRAFT_1023991 [Mycena belliarum]|uniref:Uncharacterized protein n=1 Tax=Mycena belliarum TaxID=1033014 RepID=A0AAD6TYH7_9AGAR|nr:hypothetical protein B0H15DRAFT_1023991 [Mycena belliae]
MAWHLSRRGIPPALGPCMPFLERDSHVYAKTMDIILFSPSRYRTSSAMVDRWIKASGTGPLSRWRVFEIELCDTSLLAHAGNSFPSLETLVFSKGARLWWSSQLSSLKVADCDPDILPLAHPKLRVFDLTIPYPTCLSFRSFVFPNLERLSLNGLDLVNTKHFANTEHLLASFASSGRALRSLALREICNESGDAVFLLAALPLLPRLRALAILPSGSDACYDPSSFFHLSAEFLTALGAATLLPDLQHLALHSCVGFSDIALVDMICARWGATPRLRTVDVVLNHALDPTQLARLSACRDARLDFRHWEVLERGPRVQRDLVSVAA